MMAGQCDRCERVFRMMNDLERRYAIHRVNFDGRLERNYCNKCLSDLFNQWEPSGRKGGVACKACTGTGATKIDGKDAECPKCKGTGRKRMKLYRASILDWITSSFRLWLLKIVAREIPVQTIEVPEGLYEPKPTTESKPNPFVRGG